MRLVRLNGRPPDWNARIARYAQKTLFHETCWHDHVLDIHPGSRVEYFEIRDGASVVGLFCVQQMRKMMLPIWGSPMPGTGTNYMGPVFDAGVDARAVLRAVLTTARRGLVAHVELATEAIAPEQFAAEGVAVETSVTHLIPLAATEKAAWDALRGTARNRVNRAQKNGLVAETTDDPAIVEQFYEQFIEVYGKQGMVTPFGVERPRSLFSRLMPAGRLLPVRVKHGEEVIAAGLFPYDERTIYFWGAGSWLKDQHLAPNELLQWTVMRLAVERGVRAYNMCGGQSQFKDKFGGADVPYNLYNRSFLPLLGKARDLYRALHWRRLRLQARLRGGEVPTRPERPASGHANQGGDAPAGAPPE